MSIMKLLHNIVNIRFLPLRIHSRLLIAFLCIISYLLCFAFDHADSHTTYHFNVFDNKRDVPLSIPISRCYQYYTLEDCLWPVVMLFPDRLIVSNI